MRIAIISPWNPWPVDSGSRQRADLIVRGLACNHDVFLIYGLQQPFHGVPALMDSPADVDRFLTFRWPRGEQLPKPSRVTNLDIRPLDIQRMQSYIPSLEGPLATFSPDVILALEADGALIAHSQQALKNVPLVIDQWEPSRILNARIPTRLRSTIFWRRVMQNASGITVVTADERRAAGKVLGEESRVHIIENQALHPAEFVREPASNTLVFIGNLDYQPNRDGILWFIDHVLPTIQKEMSGVNLQVIGRGAPLYPAGLPVGVSLHGFVSDLSPYYQSATVAINPVRSGHGSRVKNQCAIAHAVPLVTFPDSSTNDAQGIHVVQPSSRSEQDFAVACVRFLQNPPAMHLHPAGSASETPLIKSLTAALSMAVRGVS